MLHWQLVQQMTEYKVALLTFKVRNTSTPAYLHRLIQDHQHSHTAISHHDAVSTPYGKDICKARFPMLSSAVWNSLPKTVLNSDSVTAFTLMASLVSAEINFSQLSLDNGGNILAYSKAVCMRVRVCLCAMLKYCGQRVAAPWLWNELPPDIRKSSTLATFKEHLRTFLFCKHYGLVLEQ